jgi:hypothetical protein
MILVSLVGEQPAPNLLPARRLRPDAAVLVATKRTERIANNLASLLEPHCDCLRCDVDPYHLPEIRERLESFIDDTLSGQQFVFNLTGGTKPMVLAAYELARHLNSSFVYFQTEGSRSCLYRYAFVKDGAKLQSVEELPNTISLDDYLRVHVGFYKTDPPRDPFEQHVFEALSEVQEIAEILTSVRPQNLGALEVDFAVRCGNQVGIGEVKRKAAKAGIDQINAVAHPRYLGTYVRKFLVSGHPVHPNNQELAEAYRIRVIELPSYSETDELSSADKAKLSQVVVSSLGGAS